MAAKGARRHQFTVVIDGVDLDEEVLQRINASVQKAAVIALADLELQGDFRVHFPTFPRPDWWGLWLDPIGHEQLEKGGIPTIEELDGPGFRR